MNATSDRARLTAHILMQCAIGLIYFTAVLFTPTESLAGNRQAAGTDSAPSQTSTAPTAAKQKTSPAAKKSAPNPAASNSGASSTDKSDSPDLSIDDVTAQIKQLDAASDSDQPNRAKLLALYHQALDDLNRAAEQKAHIATLEKQRIAAPYQLEMRKRESAAKPGTKPAPVASLPATASLDTWEEMLASTEQELDAAQKTADDKEAEQQRRAARRLEIPQSIAAARMKLDELDQSSADSAGDPPPLVKAKQIARQAQRLALQTDIADLEEEIQTYNNASAELLSLERDAAEKAVEQIQQRATAWREAVNARRKTEADKEATEARLAAVKAVPAVRQLADENSQLASQRAQLTSAIEHLTAERQAIDERLDKIGDQFKQATDKLSATGMTDAVGQMLLKERSELAVVESDRRAVALRQQEIGRVQLELFEFQESVADLHNLDARVEELRTKLPKNSEINRSDLRRLLETKRKYLTALIDDDNSYFSSLVETDTRQRELLNQADAFRDYIDQRVLWIRSARPLAPADLGKAAGATAWLLRPTNWWSAAISFTDGLRQNAGLSLLAGSLFIAWVASQRWLRSVIVHSAVASTGADGVAIPSPLRRAARAVSATVLIAAIWPTLACGFGYLIAAGSPGHGDFPGALGTSLQLTAVVLLPLLLIRQICRHDGLAEAHFGWPRDVLLDLRRHLTRLAIAGVPALIVVGMLEAQPTEPWKDSLGRIVFVASQLLIAAFAFSILQPPHGPLHRLMIMRSDSWTCRLALPTFFVMLVLPLALASLAVAGYYYTALRLTARLQTTVWLVLSLVIGQTLISIWLTGVYRKLAVRTAARITRSSEHFAEFSSTSPPDRNTPEPTLQVDLEKVDEQTQGLLHNLAALALAVGLCFVWLDMFPALRFFNQITIWGGTDTDAAITLGNLLEAALVVGLTIVAASNLPSLLDLAVLQHLMPDRGSRYALVAIIRYSVIVVGVAVAGATVGIGWSKLQWLIAAMSFGLGFGLQEIFANFVSGLIVLFERPVRVGDTVTVGDVTGVVSRIKMRATTILDADRKELILPNKDLVSGRLVNWTLTDSVVRLVIRLGIAYGSDTAQAQRLLVEVASKTPEVLKTPSPKAVFMGFGEKSLDFELRVFVNSVDLLLPVRHQLNMAIDRTFHAAGVEIAFAQPDTYIRNSEHAQALAAAGAMTGSKEQRAA